MQDIQADRLVRFLDGLLAAWAVDGAVTPDGDAAATIVRVDGPAIRVLRTVEPFGVAWTIEAAGERTRRHASAQGAIRTLGALLAPDRPAGRVVFAAGGAE
mgnify:CR=1 FL=1|jgi:hypothetical protein